MFFTNIFEKRIIFFYLGYYRKRHGSVLFLLEVFSLKNEGVMAVFPKITFMTSRDGSASADRGNGDMLFVHCWKLF